MRPRNWVLFLIVVLIWGSNWTVMKSGLGYVGPLNFVSYRYSISAVALSPLLVFLRKRIPKDRDTWASLLFLGTTYAFSVASTNTGLIQEKSGIGAVLTYTQPLFVFCLAIAILKERIAATRLSGVLIGFFGVAVLSSGKLNPHEASSYSSFFLIAGAFLWALSMVYYKRFLNHVDPIVTNVVQMAVCSLLLAPMALFTEGLIFPQAQAYVFIILYASIVASSIALTLWIFLLKEEEATVLSSSSFIVPIVAFFFGWMILGENVELSTLLGAGLVIAGVHLVNRSARPASS